MTIKTPSGNKPLIIPFFLPHQGCPHRCVYCDQHLSGGSRPEPLDAASVRQGLETALSRSGARQSRWTEAAFFGGTFTALPLARQKELLEATRPFLDDGRISGIRLSTRPDALDNDQVSFLRDHGVTTVEIGVQSMDDAVLLASRRGHAAETSREAAQRVKAAGLRLGVQLLPGLPAEDAASRKHTLEAVMELTPQDARIYPLLVLAGTPLADMFQSGAYRPMDLDQAVETAAYYTLNLEHIGTRIIRVGIQDTPGLAGSILAGPYHPAFGELVRSSLFFQAFTKLLTQLPSPAEDETGSPALHVASRDISKALGQGRSNLRRLTERFSIPGLGIRSNARLEPGTVQWDGQVFSLRDILKPAQGME